MAEETGNQINYDLNIPSAKKSDIRARLQMMKNKKMKESS
jgi:hypothetical protein